jgi:hypothetical protein
MRERDRLVRQLATARAEVADVREKVEPAVQWMEWWINEGLCECEGIGHNCGLPDRQRECRIARAALGGEG